MVGECSGMSSETVSRARRDLKTRHERRFGVVTSRIAVLTVAGVLGTALAGSARPCASRTTASAACGPRLCIPSANGWFSSVEPGVVAGHPAAWLLVGNFRIPPDAAGREATPFVPSGKVLISLADFPVTSASAHWSPVQRLHLPQRLRARRVVSWHVRFSGRAVPPGVHFGSAPTPAMRRSANARLLAIRPRRR